MPLLTKQHLTTALFILISLLGFSQKKIQGKAEYYSNTQINTNRFNNSTMSEEQKKRMIKRMTNMFQKEYILIFNQTESIFKVKEKSDSPNQKEGRRSAAMSGSMDGNLYKNLKEKQQFKNAELFGKKFLINEPLAQFDWKMTGKNKNIGQYICFEATTKRIIKDVAPKKEGEKFDPFKMIDKEIDVVAWYTMQIPVNNGPNDYWGLPGLILELQADKTTILCSKVTLNTKDKVKQPSKGKVVSNVEFSEISSKKLKEMRERRKKKIAKNKANKR